MAATNTSKQLYAADDPPICLFTLIAHQCRQMHRKTITAFIETSKQKNTINPVLVTWIMLLQLFRGHRVLGAYNWHYNLAVFSVQLDRWQRFHLRALDRHHRHSKGRTAVLLLEIQQL
jgi:hypothetical protein